MKTKAKIKYGYSIPEKKKDHASIDELIVSDVMQPQQQSARSTGSLVTAAIAALAGIGQIGYIIHILLRFTADPYSDLTEIILLVIIITFVADEIIINMLKYISRSREM